MTRSSVPTKFLSRARQVKALTNEIVVQWHDQLLLHIVQHKVDKLIKINALVVIFVQRVEKLVNVRLSRFLIDSRFFEMHS